MDVELRDLEQLANTRAMQNSAVQAELDGTKIQLAESNQSLASIQSENHSFQIDIEELNKDVFSKDSIISELKEGLKKTNAKYEDLSNDFESLVSMNDKLEKESSDLKSNVLELKERCEHYDKTNEQLTIKCDKATSKVSRLENEILELEKSFPERMESSERVTLLKEKIVTLEDEVGEKKQVC